MSNELAIVYDRSLSMESIFDDMISGFKKFILGQSDDTIVTICSFDDCIDFVLFRRPLGEVRKHISQQSEYWFEPRGSTALHDAICITGDKLGEVYTNSTEKPSKVTVLIITDGHENCSTTKNKERVRSHIEHQKTKYSWDYIFLGANQDAILTANRLGIDAGSALTFGTNTKGIGSTYESLSRVYSTRSTGVAASFSEDERSAAEGE